jgi:hypothetical protein
MTRLALLLAVVLPLAACKSTPSWLSLPQPTQQQGVEVTVDGVITAAQTISAVTGEAVNRTGTDLSRCTITFQAYDMHGARLGAARAVIEDWPAGDSWSFRANFGRSLESATTISSPRVMTVR